MAFGTFVFSRDPAVTEIVAAAGFDLAVIDTEHAPLGVGEIIDHLRAGNAAGLSCWVRVAGYNPAEVGRLLDLGAQGILFPHYGMQPDEAANALSALRYAPEGSRPTCTGIRASSYGVGSFADYTKRANSEVMGIGLIEDAEVVDRIEEVIEACTLTAVMPGGGGDLATSMGLHGQGTHPRVIGAARKVVETAKRKPGLKVGVYVSDLAGAEEWRALGADFLVYSIDYKVLSAAYSGIRQALA
ncbi:2-keto-3-deoxy-L-rhamnonate aldolase RhmA [Rhodoligotrophos appendicifer]|nr:aldolase/citrate lyase family protein [Rhodoligotrophos appendicifer]